MDNRTMRTLVRRLLPGYDLHERTGIPASVAIPNRNAAKQIVDDVVKTQMFLEFVMLLIDFSDQGKGIAGRKISIPYLRQILNGVYQMGFIYDRSNGIFVENPAERKTRNWGTLKEHNEYNMAFLRIDIVGNTKMVRKLSSKKINSIYSMLRENVITSVEKRNGRVWNWDGDGGLAAFCFGNMNESAVLCGMELLHELFLYNHKCGEKDEELKVRIAVHSGMFEYTSDNEKLLNSDTIKQITSIEHNHTEANSITISPVAKATLEPLTAAQFSAFRSSDKREYHRYKVRIAVNE